MSVYVRGMEMPVGWFYCPFRTPENPDEFRCYADNTVNEFTFGLMERRRKDCPLIELLPHGRLIDADALIGQYKGNILTAKIDYAEGVRDVLSDIKNTPTIIPADKEEQDA